jgi:predicted GH43/DUF377 family glycosyl hydrolase
MNAKVVRTLSLACLAVGALAGQAHAQAQTEPAQPAWELGPFTRPAGADVNPVIRPDATATFDCPMRGKPVAWEASHTFNPAATVYGGKVCVLYRAEDASGTARIGSHTSRLGLAQSGDGIHFTRQPTPVFYPADDDQKANEWDGGCEDPRLITAPDGTFVMTYTQWNHKLPRLAVATSPDLVHWTKHGPIFAADTPYAKVPTKSGAVLSKPREGDGQLVAAKVNGKFWLYWGEGDVKLATSDDLIHWSVVEASPGHWLAVLPRRPGRFDSSLAEGGPPPVLTDRGIVVIYNGRNDAKHGDPSLPAGTYAAGQALFDQADPTKLLQRPATPFYRPEAPFERSGQYAAGTTFAEGLVWFHDRWFMYYGCADSFVGVATDQPGVGIGP